MPLPDRAHTPDLFHLPPHSGLPGICGALLVDLNGTTLAVTAELAERLAITRGARLDTQIRVNRELLNAAEAASGSAEGAAELSVEVPQPGGGGSERLRVTAYRCELGAAEKPVLLVVRRDFADPAFRDILLQLDRLTSLGTLSASVAHEVRNALVAVKSFIDLLLEKHPNEELADLVRRELARIETMVAGTLKFAKPGSGEQEPLGLHVVVEHALNLVNPQIRGHGIQLTQALQAANDGLRGSSAQLQQACVNLFLNAVEAMGQGGALTVATRNADAPGTGGSKEPAAGGAGAGHIELSIGDSGPGLSAEEQARLFQPFFTTKPQGTGLGLTITRDIIEDHGGSISVQSVPGKGTTFTISLPLATSGDAARASAD